MHGHQALNCLSLFFYQGGHYEKTNQISKLL